MINMQATQRPVLVLELLSSCLMPYSPFIVEIPNRLQNSRQTADSGRKSMRSSIEPWEISLFQTFEHQLMEYDDVRDRGVF